MPLCNKAFRNYQSIFVRFLTVEIHWVLLIHQLGSSSTRQVGIFNLPVGLA